MTEAQLAQVLALEQCRFSPATTVKRFVRWAADVAHAAPGRELSPQAASFLNRLAHSYRRQLGRCMAVDCPKCPR
jgi:hypothetical protein